MKMYAKLKNNQEIRISRKVNLLEEREYIKCFVETAKAEAEEQNTKIDIIKIDNATIYRA